MINNQNLAVLSEKVAHLESAVANSTSASEISYDNTESELTADDVQGAIDEIAPALTAEGTSYDNTDSGLTAENTQAAINEVLAKLLSNLFLTNIVRFTVQLTDSNLIFIAMTNIENSDGIHIYFSATNTKKITVYKRESGVTTELYSFT